MRRLILVLTVAAVVAAMLALSGLASAKTQATATAAIIDAQGEVIGEAKLTQLNDNKVKVYAKAAGLEPGKHGIHFHSAGLCEPPAFASAGAHFNPESAKHGLHNPEGSHAGDLPNLKVRKSGVGVLRGKTDRVSLLPGPKSLFDADSSALVVHAAKDDQVTDPTGNSGARIACGVIEPAPEVSSEQQG